MFYSRDASFSVCANPETSVPSNQECSSDVQ